MTRGRGGDIGRGLRIRRTNHHSTYHGAPDRYTLWVGREAAALQDPSTTPRPRIHDSIIHVADRGVTVLVKMPRQSAAYEAVPSLDWHCRNAPLQACWTRRRRSCSGNSSVGDVCLCLGRIARLADDSADLRGPDERLSQRSNPSLPPPCHPACMTCASPLDEIVFILNLTCLCVLDAVD